MRRKTGKPRGRRGSQALVFEDFLPYVFHRIASLLSARMLERLRRHAVTIPRWRVLLVLTNFDGLSIGELAERTIISQPVLSRVVDQMERDGLVKRRVSRRDTRRIEVYLTAHGRQIYRDVSPAAALHAEQIVMSLSKTEQKQLRALLRQVTENLSAPPL
ncbi:MarR family winged helix-turn-helix transcriptional regulator [Microbacteriaceae bacterium K1510]|nr:MarR family winged helix-turn-helix transcriptional regulator [Microbacteriaceae bacterium K1510]